MSKNGLYCVPSKWVWTTIGEVTEVVRGASPRPKGDPRYFGGSIPWIMILDVSRESGKYISVTRDTVTEAGAERSRYLKSGTLILSNSGTVCVPKILAVSGCIHDGFVAFPELSENLDIHYLYYWFENIRPRVIQENRQGITQVNLNTGIVKDIAFPLPPLAEQHRIVAEIEKQFTRLDAAVAALERARANLKRYRASVLKAACEGRLVLTEAELARVEGRDYEPAYHLLARLLKERHAKWEADQLAKMQAQGKVPKDDKWKEKCQEPAGPDTTDLPKLPEGWVWTTVDTLLAEPLCNGISVKGSDTPPGVAALKLNAMSERGFKYQFIRYLPIGEKLAKDLEVIVGDFFVSRGNGSLDLVGRGTLAQDPPFQVVFPDTMIRLRFLGIAKSSAWVPTIWFAKFVRRQIEQRVKTTAGIWKIAQPEVASIVLPLPPLTEQHRIVTEVERRMSVIDELEAVITANLKRAERLRQSILKGAFEGKLVSQDPNDEPASVLLERIRAERQVEQKTTAKAISKPSQKSRRPQVVQTQADLFR
jgi:type I restriction enzyme S subunit